MAEAAGAYVSTLSAYEEGLTVVTGKVRKEGRKRRREGRAGGGTKGGRERKDRLRADNIPSYPYHALSPYPPPPSFPPSLAPPPSSLPA